MLVGVFVAGGIDIVCVLIIPLMSTLDPHGEVVSLSSARFRGMIYSSASTKPRIIKVAHGAQYHMT